jgi:hypothetical protein
VSRNHKAFVICAVRAHGDSDQAYRAAFTALKQKFEKRGEHWIAKHDSAG